MPHITSPGRDREAIQNLTRERCKILIETFDTDGLFAGDVKIKDSESSVRRIPAGSIVIIRINKRRDEKTVIDPVRDTDGGCVGGRFQDYGKVPAKFIRTITMK